MPHLSSSVLLWTFCDALEIYIVWNVGTWLNFIEYRKLTNKESNKKILFVVRMWQTVRS